MIILHVYKSKSHIQINIVCGFYIYTVDNDFYKMILLKNIHAIYKAQFNSVLRIIFKAKFF